ncbi:hypothetical protein M8C21_022772 [Ambrosia artemisiifolia]|uniref:Uncharacterized protein n=1 Tax=Ambrosia artemisiifolia TaxID=4212 RepID=A0AAD5G1W2_AMBAR|nr:hypothetical protein M8C21_022772 [Ambrosia artemisiifolia]
MIKTAEPPLNYKSEDELMDRLSKGVLLNYGKTWFSLNKKGQHCEIISIAECLGSEATSYLFSSKYNSRFATGTYEFVNLDNNNGTNVRTQFLSPGITYTVNLVFQFGIKRKTRCEPIFLRYKLQGERDSSISHLAYEREDGWWMCELYQFTCDHRIVHLQILFEGFHNNDTFGVEGIEFQPLENVEHINEKQHISDSDSYSNCEEKLPTDFEDIMKRSKNSLQWTTKEEAYSIIRKGFLIIDVKPSRHIWFSVNKNGKKCHMLPAKAALKYIDDSNMLSLPESRFGEVVQCDFETIYIKTEVQSQLLSSETSYACYLVYKLPKDQSGLKAPVEVDDRQCNSGDKTSYIYLVSAQTPVIRPKDDQNTHKPLNMPKFNRLPRQRSDGWMDVQIWEWGTTTTTSYMDHRLMLCDRKKFDGLIIEGIEYRPI